MFLKKVKHFSAQAKNHPVGDQCGGGVGTYLSLMGGVGTYPSLFLEFLHNDCIIDRGHQTLLICGEKCFYRFKMAAI